MSLLFCSCQKQDIQISSTNSYQADPGNVSTRGDEDPVIMRGHVKNTSGQGIANASVSITAAGQSTPVQSTTTGTDGGYIFLDVAQGTYDLKFTASGYVTKTVTLNVQANINRTDTLIQE